MDKKIKFNNALLKLTDYAMKNNNFVTSDDIEAFFRDVDLNKEDYDAIKTYLKEQNFNVDIPTATNTKADDSDSKSAESEEELHFIKMYMDDMEKLEAVSDEEINHLVSKLLDDDLSVVNKLTECHLKDVADIAADFRNQGANFGDLIQEGNMALMLAISEYTKEDGDFSKYIENKVRYALNNTVNEQISSDRVGQHLADKLNQLDNVTSNLSMKLGRTPEVSEIAEAMNMSKDEASTLLKISLDILSVNEDTKLTDDADTENNSVNDLGENGLNWNIKK